MGGTAKGHRPFRETEHFCEDFSSLIKINLLRLAKIECETIFFRDNFCEWPRLNWH